MDKLARTDRAMLRRIVGMNRAEVASGPEKRMQCFTSRVVGLAESCDVLPWRTAVKMKTWMWAGHVARMSAERGPKAALQWGPQDVDKWSYTVDGATYFEHVLLLPGGGDERR